MGDPSPRGRMAASKTSLSGDMRRHMVWCERESKSIFCRIRSGHYGMKIAIQGEPGSFSHEAALKLVPDAEIVPCSLSAEVFAVLADGSADAAVIPIENSLAGSVSEHFDLLLAHEVQVE